MPLSRENIFSNKTFFVMMAVSIVMVHIMRYRPFLHMYFFLVVHIENYLIKATVLTVVVSALGGVAGFALSCAISY